MTVKYSGEGIRDNTDETKVMSFDVSGVTTNTTRTLTMPDKDITLIGEDSSGKVGIGMTPTQKLEVNGGIALPTTQLLRWNNSGTIAGAIGVDNSNNMILYNTEYNTERMRILSSGGITFNGDTATANALDDYEEGTWTPKFVNYNGGADLTATYIRQKGFYIKIGRIVYLRWDIVTSSITDATQNAIGGLPFSYSQGDSAGGYGNIQNRDRGAIPSAQRGDIDSGWIQSNRIALYRIADGGSETPFDLQAGRLTGSCVALATS